MRKHQVLALTAGAFLAAGMAVAAVQSSGAFEWPRVERGFTLLYDGYNFKDWKQIGPGRFAIESDRSLRSVGGMGLYYDHRQEFKDFILRLDWKASRAEDNSGIFVRFPDPKGDPWKPVNQGYEVQVLDGAGDPKQRTGAIYSFEGSTGVPTKLGEWNTMEIKVVGQKYEIRVNGKLVTKFTGDRSQEGYFGLQNHGGNDTVWFRNIRIREL